MEGGDDVGALEDSAVVAFQVCFLQFHLIAVLHELLPYPLATLLVRLAVHGARSETALCGAEGVG